MEHKRLPNVPAITRFVREVLGCHCPDEVFQRVEASAGSVAVQSCPVDYELRIGGRLLVVVTGAAAELSKPSRLAQVVAEGQRARDAAGFNRFRLVVRSGHPGQDEPRLWSAFGGLSIRDAKTHLHVVDENTVSAFLQ